MNGYLWMSVAAMAVLVLALLLDDVVEGIAEDLGPDWLSLPVVAAVVAAFGLAAGAVAGSGGSTTVVLLAGGAGGLAGGFLAARLVRAAMRMPTDPPVRHAEFAGRSGRVITPIGPQQSGEVLVPLGGTAHKLTASADEPIPIGAEIVVVEVTSPTAVIVTALHLDH